MNDSVVPTIYARGDMARLDAVLDLVAFAARPCPLTTSLDELPKRIAAILGADVCSVYLLEGDDLVMRGNVGFPADALGEVRLAVGEGVTGMAVECMRPIAVTAAPTHARYRGFAVLGGEERYPIFLAVPVAGPTGPLGALVVQRKAAPAFDDGDIELAAALTAPIAAATERAKLTDAARTSSQARNPGGGTRRVTLSGRPVVHGRACGALAALRRPPSRAAPEPQRSAKDLGKVLDGAIAQAVKTLQDFEKRGAAHGLDTQTFASFRMILEDSRMRERALELAEEGNKGLAHGLGGVASEAARLAARGGDPFAVDRAREISDMCEALAMLANADPRAEVPRGAVLIGDHVTVFDLLISARSAPMAVVLSEPATSPFARGTLTLLEVPCIADVGGLFRWAAPGDIALVDGDHGLVRLNPSRAEVSTLRTEKKKR